MQNQEVGGLSYPGNELYFHAGNYVDVVVLDLSAEVDYDSSNGAKWKSWQEIHDQQG